MEEPVQFLNSIIKDNRRAIARLVRDARDDIHDIIASASERQVATRRGRKALERRIKGRYKQLNRELGEWAENSAEGANRGYIAKFAKDSKTDARKLTKKSTRGILSRIFNKTQRRLNKQTQKMFNSDREQLKQAFNEAMQEEGALGKNLREKYQDIANTNLKSFSFMEKNRRRWESSNYFNMVARTVTSQGAREAYIESAILAGEDLARIEGGANPCPICANWRGVIVSITGETQGFPTVQDSKDAGVWHPNCVCSLTHQGQKTKADRRRVAFQRGLAPPAIPTKQEFKDYRARITKTANARELNIRIDGTLPVLRHSPNKDAGLKARATRKRRL